MANELSKTAVALIMLESGGGAAYVFVQLAEAGVGGELSGRVSGVFSSEESLAAHKESFARKVVGGEVGGKLGEAAVAKLGVGGASGVLGGGEKALTLR
jgi:hypothetical protein